jgi:hypothetical protein
MRSEGREDMTKLTATFRDYTPTRHKKWHATIKFADHCPVACVYFCLLTETDPGFGTLPLEKPKTKDSKSTQNNGHVGQMRAVRGRDYLLDVWKWNVLRGVTANVFFNLKRGKNFRITVYGVSHCHYCIYGRSRTKKMQRQRLIVLTLRLYNRRCSSVTAFTSDSLEISNSKSRWVEQQLYIARSTYERLQSHQLGQILRHVEMSSAYRSKYGKLKGRDHLEDVRCTIRIFHLGGGGWPWGYI